MSRKLYKNRDKAREQINAENICEGGRTAYP